MATGSLQVRSVRHLTKKDDLGEEHHDEEVHLLAMALEDNLAVGIRRSARKRVYRKSALRVICRCLLEVVMDVQLEGT